jgi:hypothetical protein
MIVTGTWIDPIDFLEASVSHVGVRSFGVNHPPELANAPAIVAGATPTIANLANPGLAEARQLGYCSRFKVDGHLPLLSNRGS